MTLGWTGPPTASLQKNDKQQVKTKAQAHNFSQNLPLNEHNSWQNKHLQSLNDPESQNHNFYFQTETQKIPNDTFHSHDDQEIVMTNNEAFGTLDFQQNDIQLDADNDLL